ncbi:MAG: SDR family NAD(P)-dependent oxidoreductase [Bacillota bacterium]
MDKRVGVVLVTGASSGIGQAVARHLVQKGFRVYGTSRTVTPGILQDSPGEPVMLHMDVTVDQSVKAGMEQVVQREGRLDIVINSAGFGLAGAVEETTIEEAKAQFETLFFGTLRVCRAALPLLRRSGGGYIINISSLAGLIAIPFQGFYSAAKYALEGLTESLRMEVREFGIRVVLIEPGDLKTGFTANRLVAEKAEQDSSLYRDKFRRSLSVMQKDEQSGPPPDLLARLIEKILNNKQPRLRYTFAPFTQKSALLLKKTLPQKLFEASLMKYYHIK